MIKIKTADWIEFEYVNWKGVKALRKVVVDDIRYGTTIHHKEPQWLLKAFDLNKKDYRFFAMKDMTNINRLSE